MLLTASNSESVQLLPCRRERDLLKQFALPGLISLPRCFVCDQSSSRRGTRGDGDICRFKDCRVIEFNPSSGIFAPKISFHYKATFASAIIPKAFFRPLSLDAIIFQRQRCAKYLLPILRLEQKHIDSPALIMRSREVEYRVICDICRTALFAQTWLCSTCGRELCSLCKADQQDDGPCATHGMSGFLPTTRFDGEELETAIANMKTDDMLTSKFEHPHAVGPDTSHEVERMSSKKVDYPTFKHSLTCGRPIVVSGLQRRLQGPWKPQYFIERFPHQKVTLVDCESNLEVKSTVAEFFESFGSREEGKRVLKLKDWPPHDDFRKICPELYRAFVGAVPFPDHTRLDGASNLISHFAQNGNIPDLGPKLYNAHGHEQNHLHQGSTRLHLDVTSAINIMLFAVDCPNGRPGGALWHIFAPEMTSTLRAFMRQHPEVTYSGLGDPIHNQTTYLTPSLLQALDEAYGIRPYTIVQYPGDAVCIPAGCAHQVSNITDNIKIACDFLSVESVAASHMLINEFRAQRLARRWPEDVLQLDTSIWHAWHSLCRLYTVELSRAPQHALDNPSDPPPPHSNLPTTNMLGNHPLGIDDQDSTRELQSGDRIASIRRQQKRRARKQHLAVSARPYVEGHDCHCFLCPRQLTKSGLIDHLKSTHKISVDPGEVKRFSRLEPDAFCKKLEQLLGRS